MTLPTENIVELQVKLLHVLVTMKIIKVHVSYSENNYV